MNNEGDTQGNSEWLKEFNLALDDTVKCDSCANRAVWYVKVKCCDGIVFCCMTCLADAGTTIEIMIMQGRRVLCASCKEYSNPSGWFGTPKRLY